MEDLDLILQQYVATANNPEYNLDWDVINSKFPELTEYDPIVLQEYVATANNAEYGKDWGVINARFPEFESKLRETTGAEIGPIDLPQVDVTADRVESQEEDTWVERTLGKNFATDFAGDIYRSFKQGLAQGATVDEAFDVFKKGKDISDEELKRYIEVSDALDKVGPSDEMRRYEEIKNEAGGGVWGFMKGMIQTRGQVIPPVIVSSAAAMARTFFDSEEAAIATGATSATAAAAGSFVPIVGTVTGAIGGAVAGLTGSM